MQRNTVNDGQDALDLCTTHNGGICVPRSSSGFEISGAVHEA